jgi:hypothetical protein
MNPEPIKLKIPRKVLAELNEDLSATDERNFKYLKKYKLHTFDTLSEPNLPSSIKRYSKLLA